MATDHAVARRRAAWRITDDAHEVAEALVRDRRFAQATAIYRLLHLAALYASTNPAVPAVTQQEGA